MQRNRKTSEEKLEQNERELAGGQEMTSDEDRRTYNSSQYHTSDLSRYYGDYPEGSARYLTYDDIRGRSKWQLKIMRNEIYARHGYIFQTNAMWDHFSRQSWYFPQYYDVNSMLSKVEKSNVAYIKSFE